MFFNESLIIALLVAGLTLAGLLMWTALTINKNDRDRK